MNELKSNVKDFLIYKDDNNDVKVNVLLINNDFIEDEIEEAIVCHYSENEISPKIINKLGFKYQNSIISKVSNKEIKRYMKKL